MDELKIGHDEMARRRIESLEAHLRLAYCARHNVHFPATATSLCPKRTTYEECYVSALGVPV